MCKLLVFHGGYLVKTKLGLVTCVWHVGSFYPSPGCFCFMLDASTLRFFLVGKMPTDFRIQGFSAALLCKHCVLWPWHALPLCEPSFLCALMLKSINGILWRLNTQDSRSMSGRHRSSPAATTRSWSTWSLWSCGVVSKMLAWLEALKIDGIRRLHGYPTVSCLVTSGHWPKFQVTIDFQGSSELLLVCDMDVGTVTAHQYLYVKFAHIYMSIYIYKYVHAFIPVFILWTYMWLIDCVVAAHAIIDMYPYINLHHSFIPSFLPFFIPSFLSLFFPSFPPPFIHKFFHILSFIKYAFREKSNRAIAALLDSLDSYACLRSSLQAPEGLFL